MQNNIIVKLNAQKIIPGKIRTGVSIPIDQGGLASFEGIVRNENQKKQVQNLYYEAYQALAEGELNRIANKAQKEYDLGFIYVQHRLGLLEIGDTAVYILASSKHRDQAFCGCRYVIDTLKKNAPIWKKETYTNGTQMWVGCNHS